MPGDCKKSKAADMISIYERGGKLCVEWSVLYPL